MILCIPSLKNVNNLNINPNWCTIHTSPQIEYSSSDGFSTNFDYLVDFSDDVNTYPELGDKYINAKRLPKRIQAQRLNQYGISTPPTLFIHPKSITKNCGVAMCAQLSHMGITADADLIVKIDDGARGIGQVKLKFNDLRRFANNHLSGDVANPLKLDADYYTVGGDDSKGKHLDIFNTNSYLIQVAVPVRREWRVLFGNDGALDVVERTVNNQSGFQANSGVNNTQGFDAAMLDWIGTGILNPIINSLPFGSIDVYQDDRDGSFGVFEYCPQFNYQSHDPNTVFKMVNNGFAKFIDTSIGLQNDSKYHPRNQSNW